MKIRPSLTRFTNATIVRDTNRKISVIKKDDNYIIRLLFVPPKENIKEGEVLFKGKVRVTKFAITEKGLMHLYMAIADQLNANNKKLDIIEMEPYKITI